MTLRQKLQPAIEIALRKPAALCRIDLHAVACRHFDIRLYADGDISFPYLLLPFFPRLDLFRDTDIFFGFSS